MNSLTEEHLKEYLQLLIFKGLNFYFDRDPLLKSWIENRLILRIFIEGSLRFRHWSLKVVLALAMVSVQASLLDEFIINMPNFDYQSTPSKI